MTRKPIIVTITTILAVALLVGFAYGAGHNNGSHMNGNQHARIATTQVAAHRDYGSHAGWMSRTQGRTRMRGQCCGYGYGWDARHQGRHHDGWMRNGYMAGSGTAARHHTRSWSAGSRLGSRSGYGYQDHHNGDYSYSGGYHDGGWDHDCW